MKKVVIGVAVLVVLGGGLALLTIGAAGIVYYASVDAPEEEIVTLEQVLDRPEEDQPDVEGTEAEDSPEAAPQPVPEPQAVAPAPRSAPAPSPRPRTRPAPAPAPAPQPEPEPAVDDLPEDDAESLDRVLEDFVIEDLDSEPESKRRRRN